MPRLSDKKYQRGFTLIEVLISLSILLMMAYSSLSIYRIIMFQKTDPSTHLYLGIIQLREEMLDVSDIEVTTYSLSYIKNNQRFSIELINQKLIKTPGTDIILKDIDNLFFYIQNNSIFISFKQNMEDYHFMISFLRGNNEED